MCNRAKPVGYSEEIYKEKTGEEDEFARSCSFGVDRMLNKCRIGKQFRCARKLLLGCDGGQRARGEKERPGEKPEKASRNTEAEDEQPDKLFPQEGIHIEVRGLSRRGIAINSSAGNATGQVVERAVRKQARENRGSGRKRDVCRCG